MIIDYFILIFIVKLSFIEGIYQVKPTIKNDSSGPLEMDEAYLIIYNMISSDNITLFGNTIQCEKCDLELMTTVDSDESQILIIDTKYAYDLRVQSLSSNISSSCQFKSYKFDENGRYLLHIMENTSSLTYDCSIEQIGNLSNYMAPAIVGIVVFILYAIVVQILQRLYQKRYFNCFNPTVQQQLINDDRDTIALDPTENMVSIANEFSEDANVSINKREKSLMSNPISLYDKKTQPKGRSSKRLHGLDTFRGFALMVMIFVNYGGGGYWFFDHSTWNGLTLADLVFPWFTWMMGISIVLSQRSLRSKNVSKRNILLKICRRTIILFVLGLSTQSSHPKLENLRILGVLQRLALCYFFTAIIVLIFDKKHNQRKTSSDNGQQSFGDELVKCVFQYWIQWGIVLLIVTIWLLLTFLLHVPGCPTGYLGPGGDHDHGKYQNCTGGAAGYVDRVVLGSSHLYGSPTCKEIYRTNIRYDPEGILGNLTGILLCYLGVQAGHIFAHSTRVNRVCLQWIVWGVICGSFGLGLSNGAQTDSLIPINKNMWSLTFVLILSSLAFFNLTVLYLLVDVYQWFTGAPFLWLGMNSIVIYVCHERFEGSFPVQFGVNNTHAAQLSMNLYGSIFWSLVAGVMYYKKVFIAI